jgi:2-polyprenyl-3-methyl-5-hydroxy-6-metoxy-1,4-benzoquinol methylase
MLISITVGCALIGHPGPGSAQSSDERVWQEFLQWLPSAPPLDNVGPLYQQYRKRLVAAGVSEPDADKQLAVIRKMSRTRPEARRIMFNNIYSNPNASGFSTSPNALLVSTVKGRKPGRALDVGMGQGRNAVFLAVEGWNVTGFDISDAGLEVAKKNAARIGVEINTVLKSREEFDFGVAQWDLIVITYETIPLETPSYGERLRNSLRAGGLIVVETTASDAGQPLTRSVDVDPGRLLRTFDGFRILHFEDTVATPDWGQGKTRLVRLVAEKKP